MFEGVLGKFSRLNEGGCLALWLNLLALFVFNLIDLVGNSHQLFV
jgi:hypothetical protein